MAQTEEYYVFIKQLEMIYLYYHFYHLNFDQIAYIVGSHPRIIECYCLFLFEQNSIKKHIKESISEENV